MALAKLLRPKLSRFPNSGAIPQLDSAYRLLNLAHMSQTMMEIRMLIIFVAVKEEEEK